MALQLATQAPLISVKLAWQPRHVHEGGAGGFAQLGTAKQSQALPSLRGTIGDLQSVHRQSGRGSCVRQSSIGGHCGSGGPGGSSAWSRRRRQQRSPATHVTGRPHQAGRAAAVQHEWRHAGQALAGGQRRG